MLRLDWGHGALGIAHPNTGLVMVSSSVRSRHCETRLTSSPVGCATIPSCRIRLVRRQQERSATIQSSFCYAVPRIVGGMCMFLRGCSWLWLLIVYELLWW